MTHEVKFTSDLTLLVTVLNCVEIIELSVKKRKEQHQNPEFGHTHGEIFKKTCKKYIRIQWGMKLGKPSILVVN
jgi:hypothetical protein